MNPTLFHRNVSILTELILDFEKETSSQKWLTVRILYSLSDTTEHLPTSPSPVFLPNRMQKCSGILSCPWDSEEADSIPLVPEVNPIRLALPLTVASQQAVSLLRWEEINVNQLFP